MDYRVIRDIRNNKDQDMVLATIVGATGSTPRHAGTNMLVYGDGSFSGTLGGGTAEERMRKRALEALEKQESTVEVITLNDDMAMQEGMICGGTMEVHLDYVTPERQEIYVAVLAMIEEKKRGILYRNMRTHDLCIVNDQGEVLQKAISEKNCTEKPDLAEAELERILERERFRKEGDRIYEAIVSYERLIICGAGHISMPISEMATRCEFEVTVIDDRETFANRTRFPWVDQVVVAPFEQALLAQKVDASTYVVLVTRGHSYDATCLRTILKGPWKYVGMIGSQTRVKKLLANLEADGFARELLDKIHTPIGLNIGAETPEEIAISILAELIMVRRKGEDLSLI